MPGESPEVGGWLAGKGTLGAAEMLDRPPSSLCSAMVCEEKLRYAAYNCVAIDTDMSPWEE